MAEPPYWELRERTWWWWVPEYGWRPEAKYSGVPREERRSHGPPAATWTQPLGSVSFRRRARLCTTAAGREPNPIPGRFFMGYSCKGVRSVARELQVLVPWAASFHEDATTLPALDADDAIDADGAAPGGGRRGA